MGLANDVACSSSGTCIPTLQWFEFSSEVKELWQSLPEADQAIILGASSKSGQSPMTQMPKASSRAQCPFGLGTNTKKLSSNLSEIAIEDEDPVSIPIDSNDDSPDPSPAESDTVLLANVTKQKQTWTHHMAPISPHLIFGKFFQMITLVRTQSWMLHVRRKLWLMVHAIMLSMWCTFTL
jgi:hypothetical protein